MEMVSRRLRVAGLAAALLVSVGVLVSVKEYHYARDWRGGEEDGATAREALNAAPNADVDEDPWLRRVARSGELSRTVDSLDEARRRGSVRRRTMASKFCSQPEPETAAHAHVACAVMAVSSNNVDTWREFQDNVRRSRWGRANPHPRCPTSEKQATSIVYRTNDVEWWQEQAGMFPHGKAPSPLDLDGCSVPCVARTDGSVRPEDDIVMDVNIESFAAEAPGSAQHPYIRAAWGAEAWPGQLHDYPALANIDMLVSFDRASDVFLGYGFTWSLLTGCGDPSDAAAATRLQACLPPIPTRAELREKRLVASFVSNCGDGSAMGKGSQRVYFLEAFSRRLEELAEESRGRRNRTSDNYGSCARSPHLPPDPTAGIEHYQPPGFVAKAMAFRAYKFGFAFENDLRRDYVTEKAYQPLLGGAVPIYWGPPNAGDFFPGGEGSFINALDFAGPRELAEFVWELDQDDERYLAYFAWRRSPSSSPLEPPSGVHIKPAFRAIHDHSVYGSGERSFFCRACKVFREEYCGLAP